MVKFNIDLSFSEMRKLYWIKFINAYTQREKESWRVYKRNYENSKLTRQILVVYLRQNIFIWCIKFWIYGILLGQLKLVSTFFIFVIKKKLLKNYQNSFYFTKKASFVLNIFKFLYFFLTRFLLFLAIAGFTKEVGWW